MIYFPQLSSGALGQYPITKRRSGRTIVNECPDGSQVKFWDSQSSAIEWELTLSGLSTDEWNAIATLFAASEGRLQDFVFLDPTDNLLRWSEDLTSAVWSKDSALQLTAGVGDPLGSQCATRVIDTGEAGQGIRQTLGAPAALQYCFSVFARSAVPTNATLFQSTDAKRATKSFAVGPEWSRLVLVSKLEDSQASTAFGITLETGAQLDVFGWQVEAQPGASAYKKTTSRCGIYPQARFKDDSLNTTTTSADQHSCVIRIVSQVGDQG